LLSLCGDSAIVLRHCADSRSGKSMGRISGGVFQIRSRAIRARLAGDLRTRSGGYGRGTANKMWVVAKCFLFPRYLSDKSENYSLSQKISQKNPISCSQFVIVRSGLALLVLRKELDHHNALAHGGSTCRSTITGSLKSREGTMGRRRGEVSRHTVLLNNPQ
jgi:hypothetical protein